MVTIEVRAFADKDDISGGPCGYAKGHFYMFNDDVIRKLKRQAREDLKRIIHLKKNHRCVYKVSIKY